MITLVQVLKTVDKMQDAYEAGRGDDYAAEAAKLTAMIFVGVATEAAIRVAWPLIRLGYAVSGRMDQWEKISALGGFLAAELTGHAIDAINDMHLGSRLYDVLHPTDAISDNFNAARTPPRGDPLVLDLDGDGIETVAENGYRGVLFDHNGDGVKTATGWVSGDDGMLVLDRNGNGMIDSGAELFGDNTAQTLRNALGAVAASGFNALQALNTNADGKIDASDAQFANLRVWRDLNQDGTSQANELFTLNTFGITSLDLGYTSPNTHFGNGNTIARQGSFTRADGSTGTMGDLNLRSSTLEREFITPVAVTATAAALPELQGAGMVRDLREAVSGDASGQLAAVLATYSAATTRSGQRALLDNLLGAWADTSSLVPSTTSEYDSSYYVNIVYEFSGIVTPGFGQMQDQQRYNEWLDLLADLERFNGRRFFDYAEWRASQSPSGNGVALLTSGGGGGGGVAGPPQISISLSVAQMASLQQSYDAMKDYVYQGLLFQTRLKPYADAISVVAGNGQLALDFVPVEAMLAQTLAGDTVNGLTDITEFVRYGQNMFVASNWDGNGFLLNTLRSVAVTDAVQGVLTELNIRMDGVAGTAINGTAKDDIALGGGGDDTIFSQQGNDLLFGEAGNDSLNGADGNDTLIGGAGNDSLSGGDGNDILDGGAGNDSLFGGVGNDVYLFGRGAGQDSISNYDSVADKVDVIQLTADVLPSDVTLSRSVDNLVLTINGTTDKLTVNAYFNTDATSPYKVEQILFANGTVWDVNTVKTMTTIGTTGNDTLTGYAGVDTINGLAGNDTISSRAGDDILDGGAGNDALNGEDGNDTLRGGADADTLSGGNGNDILDGGAGNDWMMDGGAGNDTYLFGRGAGQDTISNYDPAAGKVDAIQFAADVLSSDVALSRSADNLILTINGTTDKLTVMAYFNADTTGPYKVEQIKFANGTVWDVNTVKALAITGTAGVDTLTGYAVADTINGLAGNDTISSRAGDDILDGGAGNDSLNGEDGNDTLRGGADGDILSGGNGNDILDGGAGNDWMMDGGAGNDTYLFGRGAGQDTISNYDPAAGNTDVLSLGNDITTDQLWFRRVGSSLEVSIIGTNDKTTISGWYAGSVYHVEQFQTSNGKTLLDSQVENLVNAMAAFVPPAAGQITLPQNYQDTLVPVIAANWQ